MAKKTVVHLRVYKGEEVLKKEDGSVKNENWTVKIEHGSAQWLNFMKNLKLSGFCKVTVEKVAEVTGFASDEKVDVLKDISSFEDEVKTALKANEVKLTPEQQTIKELQERLAKLEGGSKEPPKDEKTEKKVEKTEPPKKDDGEDDLTALREEYKKLNPEGKAAFNGWGADVLKQKIEEFKK